MLGRERGTTRRPEKMVNVRERERTLPSASGGLDDCRLGGLANEPNPLPPAQPRLACLPSQIDRLNTRLDTTRGAYKKFIMLKDTKYEKRVKPGEVNERGSKRAAGTSGNAAHELGSSCGQQVAVVASLSSNACNHSLSCGSRR